MTVLTHLKGIEQQIPGKDFGNPHNGTETSIANNPLNRKPIHQAPTHRGLVDVKERLKYKIESYVQPCLTKTSLEHNSLLQKTI